MKFNVIQPNTDSMSVVQSAINDGDCIYRSPHVGNVNNSELSLILGLSEMGANVQVELVDSIRGDDRYARPQVALIGEGAITLASRRAAKSRVVGGCTPSVDAVDELIVMGVKVETEIPPTLRTLHVGSLRQAMPETVDVAISSEYFATIGNLTYAMVLEESTSLVGRPLRMVDAQGKPREVCDVSDFSNVYGMGENPDQGLLPPLEAMMAIEIIKKFMENGFQDGQIVHVAGPDMVKYTKEDKIMQPTRDIAGRVLSRLGVDDSVSMDYVVPCMKTIVESGEFNGVISTDIQSQYDVILANEGAK